MNIRNVFYVVITLILLSVGFSFAQEYKGHVPEYKEKKTMNSEGYQQGKISGKERTSAVKYSLMGSGVGFVTLFPLIVPNPISFVATPYLLSSSKIPGEYYQKAQERGPDYLESFQSGWKKETRSKKRTYYRWGHVVGASVGVAFYAYLVETYGRGMIAY
jgi:hypothetical protein